MDVPRNRVLTGLACVVLIGSTARTQDVEGASTKPSVSSAVIPLQYAVADEVARVIGKSLPGAQQHTRIVADPRTNSIIVSGDEAGVAAVQALLPALDVRSSQTTPAKPQRRSVSYEVVVFAVASGADEGLQLPRTAIGVIDSSDPDAVLKKLRDGVGKGGVTEVAKLALSGEDGKPWKSRQSGQIPLVQQMGGPTSFGGYQEAVLDLGVTPESGGADGVKRRLSVTCRIERFAEAEKTGERSAIPPAKQSNTLEFSSAVEDGKIVMAAVESGANKNETSYVLFIRVK